MSFPGLRYNMMKLLNKKIVQIDLQVISWYYWTIELLPETLFQVDEILV